MKRTRNIYHYQIRKCRRVEDYIRNKNIIENCIDGDTDLFAEIKKQRRNDVEDEVTIDGASAKDIPRKFAEVYGELYNREADEEEIAHISEDINKQLDENSWAEIDKVNSASIREALDKIKPNKSDPICNFSSDFLKNGPEILIFHLEKMIKAFLVHGHVPEVLLLATLVPIVKDKLGDLCSSKNYRSIAISSIILKLIDWIFIKIYGHLLKCDDLQFGFQELSSTSLCSWMVYETIDQYIRKGSKVYGVLMDCNKAFDTVKHSTLFRKLLAAGVPVVFVRMLLFMYRKQTADVRWRRSYSQEFTLRNGVRQGAVLSPLLFCFYMNDLFSLMRKSGAGCHIDDYYAGIFGYADDLLLISPSRDGLQKMLSIAETYSNEHKIEFSTDINPIKSKTKGIIFSKTELEHLPVQVTLNENLLPWVTSGKYLGNRLTSTMDGYQKDATEKRAQFIEKNIDLNQEFYFAHPAVKSRINQIYNSSFSGSMLWNFRGEKTRNLVNSWSVAVKQMWNLPYNTHKRFLETLGGTHAQVKIYSNYIGFIQSMKKSSKLVVLYLLEKIKMDLNTMTGQNIRYILEQSGERNIFKIKPKEFKNKFKFAELPADETWKTNLIRELTDIKHSVYVLTSDGEEAIEEPIEFNQDELDEIMDYVCTM